MLALKASGIAREAMEKGDNCCEAVLLTANEIWRLDLSPDTIAAGLFFREGMDSGCSCGALVGLLMVSGILSQQYSHPLGKKLPSYLCDKFKDRFGSSCCRVICHRRPLWERAGKKGCLALTGDTAAMLVEVWEEVIRNGKHDFRDYTNA